MIMYSTCEALMMPDSRKYQSLNNFYGIEVCSREVGNKCCCCDQSEIAVTKVKSVFRRAFSLKQCTRSCCRRERGAFCVSWCFSSRGRSASGTVCVADESIGAGMSSEATNGDAQPPPVVCCSSARRQRLFSRTVARFSADRASNLSSPAILDPNNQGGGDVASRTVMSDPVPARNITVREKRRLAAVSRIVQAKTPVSAGFVVDDLSVTPP